MKAIVRLWVLGIVLVEQAQRGIKKAVQFSVRASNVAASNFADY